MDADADTDDDPAKHRLILIDDRSEARGSIVFGLAVLLAAIPILLLSVSTNDAVLLLGTFLVPTALGIGAKCLVSGLVGHSVASFRLRQLHSRRTGLPPARLVD